MKKNDMRMIGVLALAAVGLTACGRADGEKSTVTVPTGGACCPGCLMPEPEQPKTEVAEPAAAAEVEAVAQTRCPIMGLKIVPDMYVDHAGKRIYVCCAACIARVEADPEAAMKTIRERGESVADVPSDG
jgi:hypothetical protein